MNEFTSSFWSGWVTVVVTTSLAWLALLYAVCFGKRGKSAATDTAWDETLAEGENPPPVWWFVFLLAAVTFTVVYLVLYPAASAPARARSSGPAPGISPTAGPLRPGALRPVREVGADPRRRLGTDGLAMETAANIYLSNCSGYHGPDARGQANLFPDLTDDEWIWGDEEQLRATLFQGRRAAMPPWGAALKEEGVDNVARYVLALSKSEGDDPRHADGKASYGQVCAACTGCPGRQPPPRRASAQQRHLALRRRPRCRQGHHRQRSQRAHMPAQQGRLHAPAVHLLIGWLLNGAHI